MGAREEGVGGEDGDGGGAADQGCEENGKKCCEGGV
jgi:hypothetical protein